MNLKEKRAALMAQLKEKQAKLNDGTATADEMDEVKSMLTEVKSIDEQIAAMREQADLMKSIGALDGIKTEPVARDDARRYKSAGDCFVDEFKAAGNTRLKSGFGVDFKASTDVQVTGGSDGAYAPYTTMTDTDAVFPYRRPLVIADLFSQGTMGANTNAVKYPVFGELEGAPGMVGEAAAKPQLHFPDPTWVTDDLKEVAGWFAVSDNMLDDLDWLRGEITDFATYNMRLVEETQLLSGDGSDNNIKGLFNRDIQTIAQGTDSDADRIFKGRKMIANATGFMPDGIIINPTDYEAIRLSKDANGQYYGGGYFSGQYGNGGVMQDPPLWALRTVVTEAVAKGTAVIGAFTPGGKVLRKGGLRVESTNSHADYFTSDKVAIRIKERLTLQVKYPKAFVKVSLGKAGK